MTGSDQDGVTAALGEAGLELAADGWGGDWWVEGDTFRHRELIKQLGGRWDGQRRRWLFAFDGTGARRPVSDAPRGLAEAGGSFQGWGSKHYHGHRDRLRQRFLQGGEEVVADYELLELLLFFSVHRRDTKPIAKAMLQAFGGLGGVLAAEPGRYQECLGAQGDLSPELRQTRDDDLRFTQVLLKALHDLYRRVLKEELRDRPLIDGEPALLDYLRLTLQHEVAEQFRILFLDRKNLLIREEVQSRGTVDQTPLYPREVVRRALEVAACGIIMVHNHPSGDPTPSRADIELTRQLAQALRQVNVAVLDHIIIGRNRHLSFNTEGLLP